MCIVNGNPSQSYCGEHALVEAISELHDTLDDFDNQFKPIEKLLNISFKYKLPKRAHPKIIECKLVSLPYRSAMKVNLERILLVGINEKIRHRLLEIFKILLLYIG
jgi:hypothetical protein